MELYTVNGWVVCELYLITAVYINKREKLKVPVSQSLLLLVPNILFLCCLRFREIFLWCLISLLYTISKLQIYLVYLTQCSLLLDCELPEGQKCLINLHIQGTLHSLAYIFNIFKVNTFRVRPRESLPNVCCCSRRGVWRGIALPPFSFLSSLPLLIRGWINDNLAEHFWKAANLPTWTSPGTGNRLYEIMR